MNASTPGGGVGRALSRLIGDTLIHSAAATSDHQQTARIRATSAFMEHAETHYAPILREMFGSLLERDDLPDGLRSMLTHMVEPGAQFDVMLQIVGILASGVAGIMALGNVEIQPLVNELNANVQGSLIPPADLADMLNRNIVGPEWANDEAAKSGLSSDRLALLTTDTGEPPGVIDMLRLWRLNWISFDHMLEAMQYSRINPKFYDDVLLLAHDTMTAGDAIELALKQIVDTGTAQDYFVKAGGLAEQFGLLVAAAGNPIGPEAAVNLWAHGEITDAELQSVVAHSRINPMFYDLAKLTHLKWLGIIQVEIALKAGTVTPEAASSWLAADGYPADQIAAFVAGASAGKTATHKALTESQVTQLFETGVFTHDQATAELVALGYDAGETDFILAVYEQRRLLSMAQAAVGQVRKVYLAGRIDKATASADLDALGIDPAARDHYLAIWEVEAKSELKELTMAQIGSAYKKGLFDDATAVAKWEAMGYSTDDAAVLLAIYGGPPPAGSPAAIAAATTPPPAPTTGG